MITILQGDWIERLKELPDSAVHCTVTSPPYDALRSYNGYTWKLAGGPEELFRVTCAGGFVCWNVGSQTIDGSESLTPFKQAVYFVEVAGFKLHDTMIYEKLNFSSPEQTRYHQAFEYVFIFVKGKMRTFNPIKDRKNIYGGETAWGENTKRQVDGSMAKKERFVYAEYGKRTNVWRGKTRGQEEPCKAQEHPALMPRWLARDLIQSFSNSGDTILDPHFGSGTTGSEAVSLGRKCIGIELNPDYISFAEQSTNVTPGLSLG